MKRIQRKLHKIGTYKLVKFLYLVLIIKDTYYMIVICIFYIFIFFIFMFWFFKNSLLYLSFCLYKYLMIQSLVFLNSLLYILSYFLPFSDISISAFISISNPFISNSSKLYFILSNLIFHSCIIIFISISSKFFISFAIIKLISPFALFNINFNVIDYRVLSLLISQLSLLNFLLGLTYSLSVVHRKSVKTFFL